MNCPRCARQIPDDAALCCYCGRSIVRKSAGKAHQRGNGSGTAIRSGRYWKAIVTVGWNIDESGKRHQARHTKSGFKTKNEALAYCLIYKTAAEKREAPNLLSYWKTYKSGRMEKLSQSKQTAYKIAWNKIQPLQYRAVDSISVSELCSLVAQKAETYYPARDMKVLLTHLFELAAADGWTRKDLPSFIELPAKNETEREAFTAEEQLALWRCYESGCIDAAIPLIMIYTGMMTGEMTRLEGSMVDFDANQIIGVGLKTKVRRESPVFFPDDIKPVLADLIAGNPGRIFTHHKEEIYARYYAALEKANVRKLTPYSCRHTTATRLAVTENVAPQTVKKIMRWSTTKMLDRYAHPDNADALEAINTLNRPKSELQSSEPRSGDR